MQSGIAVPVSFRSIYPPALCGKFDRNPNILPVFDFVLDTPSRHNQADACFCARLFVSLASPWILPLGNVQINLTLPSLIRTLACAEVLPLGKMQTSLLLPSLIRIFGRVFADVFDKPSAMPNFVRVLPRRENGCRERTIKRKKNADQRTASRPSRKLSRSA